MSTLLITLIAVTCLVALFMRRLIIWIRALDMVVDKSRASGNLRGSRKTATLLLLLLLLVLLVLILTTGEARTTASEALLALLS